MFAGLPGIGVGTLFYVLMAVWMPFYEIPRVFAGKSSLARWQLIARQLFYAAGIVSTVVFAERMLLWMLGQSKVAPLSPAAFSTASLARAPAIRCWPRRSPRRCCYSPLCCCSSSW